MFQMIVNSPNLEEAWVILIKSTTQSYSVVCGLWSAEGGLRATVDIGTLYAYASSYQGQLQDCVTIPVDIRSLPLSEGNVYRFDGTKFLQGGQTPLDFDYGLCNGQQRVLTCGLCQDVTVNGVAAQPPVCVESLLPESTTYFSADNQFWLGVGQLSGPSAPQPGLLLSTSILQAVPVLRSSRAACTPSLGTFAPVDFSESAPNWCASYQPASNSFQVQPASS